MPMEATLTPLTSQHLHGQVLTLNSCPVLDADAALFAVK
jgi:hypothetical protein